MSPCLQSLRRRFGYFRPSLFSVPEYALFFPCLGRRKRGWKKSLVPVGDRAPVIKLASGQGTGKGPGFVSSVQVVMPVLSVEHITIYRYRRPVGFGLHRLLGRPRDTADQRLLDWTVEVSPFPVGMHSVLDALGNQETWIDLPQRARELKIVNRLRVDHVAILPQDKLLTEGARCFPVAYEGSDISDLARYRESDPSDSHSDVTDWARSFLDHGGRTPVLKLLQRMVETIREDFTYLARHEEGVQSPTRTLALCSGTCRDYAVLMIEAVRALGFAARFVTGYLYCPPVVGVEEVHHGGGATHAWVEVFLPGLGWVDYDPTNAIVGSRDLIRVAVFRDWRRAAPLSGTWTGFPADFLGMDVTVKVCREEGASDEEGKAVECLVQTTQAGNEKPQQALNV